ncbi:TPA: dehydrogenase, partial [Streptococcus suis]
MKVPIESNNILIVGFGKIGKIKANKWLDRGYSVYVKDVNFCNLMLLNKGINVADDISRKYFTIEICTPTKQHAIVFKNIIKKYVFSYIIIKK